MVTLGLDFATATGWALFNGPTVVSMGTWNLPALPKGGGQAARHHDPRPGALAGILTRLGREYAVELVVFEDVQFATSTAQTQLWASFRTAAWLALPGVRWASAAPQVLKKFATGKGNADKDAMRASLPPGVEELASMVGADDNAVDAYWAARWAIESGALEP